MKTIKQAKDTIRYSAKNGGIAIIKGISQVSLIVVKYSYWFLFVFIFFSCQKNLMPVNEPTKVISQHPEKPAQKFIVIDTAKYSLVNHSSSQSLSNASGQKKIHDKMNRFYSANSFRTKWVDIDGPTQLYNPLLNLLKKATDHGLNPEAYQVDDLEQRVNDLYKNKPAATTDIVDMDIRITETFFLFITHLHDGRISDAGNNSKIWIAHHHQQDYSDVSMLASVRNPSDLNKIITTVQPAHEQYTKLQKQLVMYRALETYDNGQLPLSIRESIKPANKHVAIPAVRKKLSLMEIQDSPAMSSDSLYYDAALVLAVKNFQQRHGLEQDGVIGGKTLVYLNQSFKEKADLIALNMERMRWLPTNVGAQFIRVNIPEYKLRIYEQGARMLEMNVIVGAVSTATPVFSDTLEHVVFSPTWTVPPSLVKDEFLARLRKNQMYYSERKDFIFYKKGAEIDPSTVRWDSAVNINEYRIVQKPGSNNALGLAKFIMPNNMNIYLHDTPDHKPFSYSYRALSHGCIRLEDPARLAAYLLKDKKEWELSNIKKAMTSGKPIKIILKEQCQVHLEYRTVWTDDNGDLNFGEDIYGHDKRQLQRLNQLSSIGNSIAAR